MTQIKIKIGLYNTVKLKIGDIVVFDCYDKDWKATEGKIIGFESDGDSANTWVWLKCTDGSIRKRLLSDLTIGLIRKVF